MFTAWDVCTVYNVGVFLFVHMCMYVGACIVHMYVHICIHAYRITCVNVPMYVCTCVVEVHVRTYIH